MSVHVYVVRATYSGCSQSIHLPKKKKIEPTTTPRSSCSRKRSHHGSNKQMPNYSLANANCMPAPAPAPATCASRLNANAMRPQAGLSRPVAPARYRLQCDGEGIAIDSKSTREHLKRGPCRVGGLVGCCDLCLTCMHAHVCNAFGTEIEIRIPCAVVLVLGLRRASQLGGEGGVLKYRGVFPTVWT